MINNFRVRYTDVERNAPIASVGSKTADVIRHALQAKHGVNFVFEKHDGNTWTSDSETQNAFLAKKRAATKNAPDMNFAASLSSLASASAVLAKLATKSALTHEQKQELFSLMNEVASSGPMRTAAPVASSNPASPVPASNDARNATANAAPAKR